MESSSILFILVAGRDSPALSMLLPFVSINRSPLAPSLVEIKFADKVFYLVPNMAVEFYSSALSLQLFGSHFIAVPRFIWVSLVGGVTLILAVAGRNVFDHILQNLLPILGYWTICFGLTVLIEHYVFRPRLGGYDLDGWCDPKRTPRGIAGTFTLLSCIGLSFLGMSQTWVSILLHTCGLSLC